MRHGNVQELGGNSISYELDKIKANFGHRDLSDVQLAGVVTLIPAEGPASCPAWSQERDAAAVFVALASLTTHWLNLTYGRCAVSGADRR